MSSRADHNDRGLFDDDLGRLIRQSLVSRVARMRPPARGREQLLAAAQDLRVNLQGSSQSAREDYLWPPPQRVGYSHPDRDLWSGFIHARDSVRRMSL